MKREINVFDYAETILKGVEMGALLNTKANGKFNSMMISWGTLGIQWHKPIFTTFVYETRFTKQLIDANPEFTISIPTKPLDPFPFQVLGSESGEHQDKIEKVHFTPVESDLISVPGLKEVPLTLECKVIYTQTQVREQLLKEIADAQYPQDVANPDAMHTAYYGEIVKAYIIE